MADADLEKYCQWAVERGATDAKQVHSSSIVTAAWVRFKCQFGCPGYNHSYTCPPYSPTPEQTRAAIDCYHRAILVHTEAHPTPDLLERRKESRKMLVDLEIEVFKDGYYKAFVFLSGGCAVCGQECACIRGEPCNFGLRVRPSMEACGIDAYQTARNNGFFIKTLRDRTETRNYFGLLLVD